MSKKVPDRIRRRVIRRDGFVCHYCRSEIALTAVTIDHMIPLSQGGTNHPSNLVVACQGCNNEKGDRTYDEYFMTGTSVYGEGGA